MQADGQVYFADEREIPQEDKNRYNAAHAAAYAQNEIELRLLLDEVKQAAYDAKVREMHDAEGR